MSKVTLTETMRLVLRGGQPVAERLSNVADRYAIIIADQSLPFNERELLAIVTANWSSATELEPAARLLDTVAHNVADSLAFDELSLWDDANELSDLVSKINNLDLAQKIALVEYIESRKNASL